MFKTEEKKEIRSYIQRAYGSSPELILKWHVAAGLGLYGCIERTVADLMACKTLKFYVVDDDGRFVGYFGTEFDGKYMPTIFVAPEYRDRKREFWREIENKVEPRWRAGIYAKNIPCMKFYFKKGKQVSVAHTPHGLAAVFEFRKQGV
jgi:hypothetical protein